MIQRFWQLHCKKRLAIFPSPAGMSLTKISLAGNNLVWVTSRLGTGKWLTFVFSVLIRTCWFAHFFYHRRHGQKRRIFFFEGLVRVWLKKFIKSASIWPKNNFMLISKLLKRVQKKLILNFIERKMKKICSFSTSNKVAKMFGLNFFP